MAVSRHSGTAISDGHAGHPDGAHDEGQEAELAAERAPALEKNNSARGWLARTGLDFR